MRKKKRVGEESEREPIEGAKMMEKEKEMEETFSFFCFLGRINRGEI